MISNDRISMSKKFRTRQLGFSTLFAMENRKNDFLKRKYPSILNNSSKVIPVFSVFTKGITKKIELLDNKENNAKIVRTMILYFSYPIASTIFSD